MMKNISLLILSYNAEIDRFTTVGDITIYSRGKIVFGHTLLEYKYCEECKSHRKSCHFSVPTLPLYEAVPLLRICSPPTKARFLPTVREDYIQDDFAPSNVEKGTGTDFPLSGKSADSVAARCQFPAR